MSAKLFGRALEFDMGASQVLRWVLVGICDAADPDGSNVYPGIAKLRRIAQCSKRHAIRALSLLEASGLLVRVADAVQHKPTEYRIDLDVFAAVERDGFAAVLDRAGERAEAEASESGVRGDTTSPLDHDEGDGEADARGDSQESPLRGDMKSPLNSGVRGDISDARGDISGHSEVTPSRARVTQTPIDPPIDPERERARRARPENQDSEEGAERSAKAPEGKAEDDPVFMQLVADFPGAQVVNRCWPLWRKLDAESRARAAERVEAYVAGQHNLGRKTLHSLETYLRAKLFDQVEKPPAEGARFVLKLRSRDWWIVFHEWRRSHEIDPEAGRPLWQLAKNMLDLFGKQHRVGTVVKALPADELVARYGKVERGSPAFEAWAAELAADGFRIDDDVVCGAWIWVPLRPGARADDALALWPQGCEPAEDAA